jgi:hypothetical protein
LCRHSSRRTILLAWVAALSVLAWSLALPAQAHGAGLSAMVQGRAPLVKQRLIDLGSCQSHTVRLRVVIARTAYSPSQPVTLQATLRNIGKTSCSFVGNGLGPQTTPPTQYMGPCGALPLKVFNDKGAFIWPGNGAFPSCPAMGDVMLLAGSQILVLGQWSKTVGFANGRPALPGRYRLEVEGLIFNVAIS